MDIRAIAKITLQHSVKILSNIKLALIKFIIFLKSISIKLKSKTPIIKASSGTHEKHSYKY